MNHILCEYNLILPHLFEKQRLHVYMWLTFHIQCLLKYTLNVKMKVKVNEIKNGDKSVT